MGQAWGSGLGLGFERSRSAAAVNVPSLARSARELFTAGPNTPSPTLFHPGRRANAENNMGVETSESVSCSQH